MTASILVVDDERAIQEILDFTLTAEGYQVATAGSGEEALTRVEQQDFDVILTDIVMPGVDGLEVLERTRLLNPRASVIVMTAYAALETAISALRGGACDFLEKPFEIEDLKQRVRRLLHYRETIWKDRLGPPPLPGRPAGGPLVGGSDPPRPPRAPTTPAPRAPRNG